MQPDRAHRERRGAAGMGRSVVYTLHLRPPIAHAKHSAGEQRLTDHALGDSAQLTRTPGPDAEPGPVNHRPGPDFIPYEPEAGA